MRSATCMAGSTSCANARGDCGRDRDSTARRLARHPSRRLCRPRTGLERRHRFPDRSAQGATAASSALAGNHDIGFLEFLARPTRTGLFARYGGSETARSYGVANDARMFGSPRRHAARPCSLVEAVPRAMSSSCSRCNFPDLRRFLLLPCRHPARHGAGEHSAARPDLDPRRFLDIPACIRR